MNRATSTNRARLALPLHLLHILFILFIGVIGVQTLTSCSSDDGGGDDPSSSSGGGGGTFTLTDIPSQYNGKYAYFKGDEYAEAGTIQGFQSYNYSASTYTLCLISNGSVSIPLWYERGSYLRYSGNGTATGVMVLIHNSQTAGVGTLSDGRVDFQSVTFSNGNASKSWNERVQ